MDRRIIKTREALQTALFDLIREGDYEDIEIQQITDRANTARVTFYRHYATKDDLLMDCLEAVYTAMRGTLDEMRVEDVLDLRQPPPNLPLFEFLERDRILSRKLLFGPLGTQVQMRVRTYIVEQVVQVYSSSLHFADLPVVLIANHCASCLIGNVLWWLSQENDGYSSGYIARITHAMALTGALTIVGRADLIIGYTNYDWRPRCEELAALPVSAAASP